MTTRPRSHRCPTCGAEPTEDCRNLTPSGWLGAGREYHSARVLAATPDRAPSDPDPRLAPEDDPANTRPDRPAVFPEGNAHDHQEDPW